MQHPLLPDIVNIKQPSVHRRHAAVQLYGHNVGKQTTSVADDHEELILFIITLLQ